MSLIFNMFSVQYLSLTLTLLAVFGFAGSYAYQVKTQNSFPKRKLNFKIFNELYEQETESKASWLPENDFLLTEGIMKAKGLFSMRLNSGNRSEIRLSLKCLSFTLNETASGQVRDAPAFPITNYDSLE